MIGTNDDDDIGVEVSIMNNPIRVRMTYRSNKRPYLLAMQRKVKDDAI